MSKDSLFEQKKRIQEIMGRVDNNDFDRIYKQTKDEYWGQGDVSDIERSEIDYEDRDVEPDYYDNDNEYIADFSDDMTMGQDLDYGDKGFDREPEDEYIDFEKELLGGGPEPISTEEVKILQDKLKNNELYADEIHEKLLGKLLVDKIIVFNEVPNPGLKRSERQQFKNGSFSFNDGRYSKGMDSIFKRNVEVVETFMEDPKRFQIYLNNILNAIK